MPHRGGVKRALPRIIVVVLWSAAIYGLFEILASIGVALFESRKSLKESCAADGEGKWSIGIFKGSSPFDLQPIEQLHPRANTVSAWPAANPVFTCAHVSDVPSSFVADPFIWSEDDEPDMVHLFYETKSLHNMQGDIGAAVSNDGGLSFKHLGIVLDEPHHLSYPFLIKDQGKMYMLPEGSNSGTLRLYRAERFPQKWTFEKVLINEPLIDASVLLHNGVWWMFASNRKVTSSKNCRELEVWYSDTLLGTWVPHPMNPIKAGVQGARNAGRPIVFKGQVYRFGQDCEITYGHHIRAFHVRTLNQTHYEEVETISERSPISIRDTHTHTHVDEVAAVEKGLPMRFRGNSQQGRGIAWNGVRTHHLDAHQLPSGEWIGVMDGDSVVSDYLTWNWVSRMCVLLPLSALIATTIGSVIYVGGLTACATMFTTYCLSLPGGGCCCLLPLFSRLGDLSNLQGSMSEKQGSMAPKASGDVVQKLLSRFESGEPTVLGRRYFFGWSGWQLLVAVLLTVFGMYFAAWFFWTFCRIQLLSLIMWYVKSSSGAIAPIAVDGQFSKFTILVMSFEARQITLQTFVQHYSRCASVSDIVIVWNKGTPPDPLRDFDSAVPVRVRVEAQNSMNNRFQHDPLLLNRGVMLLDDDIIMPCADIERGFAKWRQHPERITGFYARLLEGNPPQYQCTQCEKYTFDSGQYNVILAGASFLDRELVFELYGGDDNKEGRAYVDRVFNCDDLLLNFIMAQKLQGTQYVQYVRPTKRFDVGKLTSKRLSTGNFGPVRHQCTEDFARMYENPLLNKSYPIHWDGLGKPWCGPPWLGCVFI